MDEKNLPKNWSIKKLDELCDIARGGSPRPIKQYLTTDENGINWIKIADASASTKYIYETKEKIKPEGISKSRLVQEGDFLLSNSMSFGRPYIMKTSGCIHDGWLVLKDKSSLFDQDYLYYFLGSNTAYEQFDNLAAGSTVRNLNTKLVKSVVVPVPPLEEQRRIVKILDEAFGAIALAEANTKKNLANARELFDSYLNKVFVQKNENWDKRTFQEVCLKIQDGAHHSPKKRYVDRKEGLFTYITSRNIRNNYMDFTKIEYVEKDFHDSIYPRCTPELGDILLTKDGVNTGNVTLNTLDEPFSLLSSVCLIKTDRTNILPAFLKYYIQSPHGFKQITGQMTGAAIKRIILKKIKSASVPFPCIDEQKMIVSKFDQLFRNKEELEKIYQRKLEALAELKQSILQKAFTGKLTI